MQYSGGCHCGAVRFDVEASETVDVEDCNCSVCAKSGFLHLIVPNSKFHLRSGEDKLVEYTFNTGVAKHRFCGVCGVKSFYIPRSNPDGVDVNVRCLDVQPTTLNITVFDGQNWEQHADKLSHKSRETKA